MMPHDHVTMAVVGPLNGQHIESLGRPRGSQRFDVSEAGI
jgi:hypothetical protein